MRRERFETARFVEKKLRLIESSTLKMEHAERAKRLEMRRVNTQDLLIEVGRFLEFSRFVEFPRFSQKLI
jgi:hypothetical protein